MKKLKKISIVIILTILLLILISSQNVFANNSTNLLENIEYSEEYQKWLELSDEEKKNVIMPRMYDVPYIKTEYKNPFYNAKMLRASFDSKYSLQDIIPSNLAIKDQMQTGSCWAFSALSSLETNLALNNYRNGINTSKIYDFSERHMEYATTRVFANNEINSIGYNRTVGSGGNWGFASSYLTNGSGAIDESEMPFENNENLINISEIQNKTVTSQVIDTIEFSNYNWYTVDESESNEIINQIKYHIQNYGSVMVSIKTGGFINQSKVSADTGALYLGSGGFGDHAVSIIGWDDNYGVENWNEFEQEGRPQSAGAWIARNSWGENNSELVYISYEDETATQSMSGIVKSTDIVEYDNIYQYDYYYPNVREGSDKSVFCNVFDKKTEQPEYLTQVSFYATYPTTCRVYINPDGTEKSKEDLQLVTLKTGETETFDVGYHTLEFSKPIEINSDQFLVAIEFLGDESNPMGCVKKDSSFYSSVEAEPGSCFKLDTYEYRYEDDWSGWVDLAEEGKISTIKAFTTNELIDESLKNIEITTPPSKTQYWAGEDFDKTGMVVKANYNSRTNPSVILDDSSYSIENGSNLKPEQSSVTITFEDKSVEQEITVKENKVENIVISSPPTKTEYWAGEDFDKTGMVVKASYTDGSTVEVTDYTIINGSNLKNSQSSITISYGDKTIEQPIKVKENSVVKIEIKHAPNKTEYVAGQNFDAEGMIVEVTYTNGLVKEITDYEIQDGNNLSEGQTTVTIAYEEKTVTQSITVVAKMITGISIKTMPSKTKYIQNREDLDLTGGVIEIIYNDGSTESIDMTSNEVSVTGFSNSTLGKITITLTYQSITTQCEIEIIDEIAIEENAENSNMENAVATIKNIKAYYFTDNSQKDYVLIDLEINKIVKNTNNDKMEYYYYLSSNADEENITDWIKISENQSGNNIKFTIDSSKISNYNELSDKDTLYLYIKEVAIKGGSQSVAISKAISLELNEGINFETYVDNAKKENVNSGNSATNNSDSTTATGKLPYAGSKILIILSCIVVMLIISIVLYKKYNWLKDILKKI